MKDTSINHSKKQNKKSLPNNDINKRPITIINNNIQEINQTNSILSDFRKEKTRFNPQINILDESFSDNCTTDFIRMLYKDSFQNKSAFTPTNRINVPLLHKNQIWDKKDSSSGLNHTVFLKPLEHHGVATKELLGNKRLTEEIRSPCNLSDSSISAFQIGQTNNYQVNSPDSKNVNKLQTNINDSKYLLNLNNSNTKLSQLSNTNDFNFFGRNLNNYFAGINGLYSNSSNINLNSLHQMENSSHHEKSQANEEKIQNK